MLICFLAWDFPVASTNANPESFPTGIKKRKVWGLGRTLQGRGIEAAAVAHLLEHCIPSHAAFTVLVHSDEEVHSGQRKLTLIEANGAECVSDAQTLLVSVPGSVTRLGGEEEGWGGLGVALTLSPWEPELPLQHSPN